MTQELSIRTAVIVALLLPGLVIAAPIAGACGLCGAGDDCHLQRSVQLATETHSCCDKESETSPEPSLDSSNCECGREAPLALTAESSITVETAFATMLTQETISQIAPFGAEFSHSATPPAPPPAPPAYLTACAFLT